MPQPTARFMLPENEINQAIREYLLNHYNIVPTDFFLNANKTCDVRYVVSKAPAAPKPRELRSEIKSRGVRLHDSL